jgi:hypothetical protein
MPQTDPVILQRLDDIDDMLENIDHAIRGNGSPGLKARMDRVEEYVEGGKWFRRTVGAAVIVAIVTGTFTNVVLYRRATQGQGQVQK